MSRRSAALELLAIALIFLTEAAVVSLHATWTDPWWRTAFWITDRWHILSALTHWPIVLFVLWRHVRPGRWAWRWLSIGAASWILWQVVKVLAGKDWPSVWLWWAR